MSGERAPRGVESQTETGDAPWHDPDDSPEWTDEMFERADVHEGDRLIRRGRRPDEDETRPERV